ncbi:hypothetical protein QAD02_011599 [Eretmocerus hayati]|uniref:Uncharacterized protein n=1 Tax=Eretmocerus hayati TaxID=131215 RepID=A0ACC2NY78_9HYME|nr:hypothetical protein QAD02_011599 [Eretmocerus hayati]
MRIFITALKQSGGVCKLRAALESFEISKDQEWAKSLPEDDYRHVYALSSNMKQYDLDALIKNTALNLVILAKHTSIFKKVFDPHDFTLDRLMRNDDILYVGAVLLKFCAVCDTHCIDNYRNYDCKKEEPCNTIGCGLLSWALGTKTSLARRNCVPNIMRCMIESNKVILYSIRPIKRGAQIIDSHASWKYSRYNIFINVPEAERKADFQERYGFFCECQACVEDWPAMNFEKNFDDFYKEVVPSATEKSLKMLDDFFMLSKRDSDLTLVERISGFSRLIQHSVENFPLPSKVTAFMIRGFIVFMSLNCEISNQFQIADKCVPSA